MRVWQGQKSGELALLRANHTELEFGGRQPFGATALVAPVFAVLVIVAWGGTVSPARAVTGGLLIVLAVGLVIWGWPRRRIVRIRPSELAVDDGQRLRPLAAISSIDLRTGWQAGAAGAAYRADLVFHDGTRLVLLERRDPALLLRDLARLLDHVSLPVNSGWGLPPEAQPWRLGLPRLPESNSSRQTPRDMTVSVPLEPNQHGVALALFLGAIMVFAIIAFMMLSRLEEGKSISALSICLAAPLVFVLLALSAGTYSHHLRFSVGAALVVERRILTFTVERTVVPLDTVREAFALYPHQGEPHHLLIQATDRLLAFACPGEVAGKLAQRLKPQG